MRTGILYRVIAVLLIFQCIFLIKTISGHASETAFITADSSEDLSVNMEGVDPLHTEPVYIDTATGAAQTEGGGTVSMKEIFDISATEEQALLSGDSKENKDQILSQFEENDLYCVRDNGKDELAVSFPFAYKRVLVFPEGRKLRDTYGAESAVYYAFADEYILDYPTETAAQEACRLLAREYGEDHVMPDLPISMQSSAFTQTDAVSSSWGNDMMHLDQVRDIANADTEIQDTVTVAVLDSGINPDHELFQGRLPGESRSFIEGSPWNEDGNGHGTHVAGIVADGTSGQVGILSLKVLGDNGEGGFGELMNAVYYAVQENADVINLSLALNLSEYGMYWTDVSYLQMEKALESADKAGCICVAAAGNDSANMDTLKVYPAISESTITVSSINQNKRRASSSNYGEGVDFAGPGDSIISAAKSGSSKYCQMSGTSMAAPHVSAACAMVSLYNKNLSNEQIKAILRSVTVDLGDEGKDKFFGEGLIVFEDGLVPGQTDHHNDGQGNTGDPVTEDPVTEDPDPESPNQLQERSQKQSQEPASTGTAADNTGISSIRKASVKISRSSYVYNGKARKPAVSVSMQGKSLKKGQDYTLSYQSNKGVGKAVIIIKGTGKYQGIIKKNFLICPRGTSLLRLRKGKKQITVKWKKQKLQTSGYQIQYSARKNFKKAVKTVTIKKVRTSQCRIKKLRSKKQYYVRIRTFKRVKGKKYYSKWSKVKSATVK